MARRTRPATSSGEGAYPAIVNHGYVSDYFLAYRLDAGLADLYAAWERRERGGDPTPRSRMRSLSNAFAKYRVDAASTAPDDGEDGPVELAELAADDVAALRDLNDAVLRALGWEPDRGAVTLSSGGAQIDVPVAHRCTTPSGLLLVALETVFATDPATVVASKVAAPGTLLDPIAAKARTVLEAAQIIFTADDAPTYILVCSGGSITLLDRNRWGEGVYVAADLDDAVARGDDRAKGELAAIAALFSADAIDPGTDAQSPLTTLIERAANESAGVSKELRHGVRRSVELLANAVVADVRYRQKGAWQQIDPDELTRQSLRYLYRIIVLLFAEARPELGILPTDDPDYQSGYSVARLRDTALVELQSDQALHATHIQQSLAVLFKLVNEGYEPDATLDDHRSLTFPGLQSALFGPEACPMLDRAWLTDATMQQVLANLCFTQPQRGKVRQSLSYATLGINQLGAVYEGLMAYRGFLATEELYEIDNDGDADTGTWVVPVRLADEFPDSVFVTEEGLDGLPRKVTYKEGDFVFRLAGRDRQRSASYYTPEVLTEFTVRHALDTYWDEHPGLTAADILHLTVCEPALGSGAFLNEAINQLAARYLKAAQDESGETIDPDQYQLELQKAKAHFAINQSYGVDLNPTAIELAEVSLWLNCMHPDLRAPRFGARLRHGNSLIGARRATYTTEQVKKRPWASSAGVPSVPPTDQPLHTVALGEAPGIHHFLLPGEGWGVAADATELKGRGGKNPVVGLAESWAETVRSWRRGVHAATTKAQLDRLSALARRVEAAWLTASKDAAQHLRAHDRTIGVWGAAADSLPTPGIAGSAAFTAPEGPAARLRLLMDAWCALWLWAPANGTALPTLDRWLDAAELLLGQPDAAESGALFTAHDLDDGTLDSVERFGRASIAEVLDRHTWLRECQRIAAAQGFFHWELDFAPILAGGGFQITVGNPPWSRPRWSDSTALAEHDPWFGVMPSDDVTAVERRRAEVLTRSAARDLYCADRAENAALNALLSARTREPLLAGIQTNLYLLFMTNTWRRQHPNGVIGLIHQESHLTDPGAGVLRQAAYERLRRHWQLQNKLKLFADVHDETVFGIHIYGPSADSIGFRQAAGIFHPRTVDGSLEHDGAGEIPGLQFLEGGWDLRPHAQRIVTIDEDVLADWCLLFDGPGTPPKQAKLVLPLARIDLEILSTFARSARRLADCDYRWSPGFHERQMRDPRTGVADRYTHHPDELEQVLLQSAHLVNGAAFGQQPRSDYRSNNDWIGVDLTEIGEDFLPRCLYRYRIGRNLVDQRDDNWDATPANRRLRAIHREYVQPGSVRTLQAAVLPPGICHINSACTVALPDETETIVWAALLTSVPYDFLTKTAGASHINDSFFPHLPLPSVLGPLRSALIHRCLRLNCLTQHYADTWERHYRSEWDGDLCSVGGLRIPMGAEGAVWRWGTPTRSDLARWSVQVEIDAISAVALGLTATELLRMYESQFRTLRRYENETYFDAHGAKVARDHNTFAPKQAEWEAALREEPAKRGERRMSGWARVQAYLDGDTSVDLGPFQAPFLPADRAQAMVDAHDRFAALAEGNS